MEQGGQSGWSRMCEVPEIEPEQIDPVHLYRRHAIEAVRGVPGANRARANVARRLSKPDLARGMRLVREALG